MMKSIARVTLARIALAGAAAIVTVGLLASKPALAWGVAIGIPFPFFVPPPVVVGPPVYYGPPAVYAPPPAYYGSSYAPAYTPAPEQGGAGPGRTCYAGAYVCPLIQPTASGAGCSCPTNTGGRIFGTTR